MIYYKTVAVRREQTDDEAYGSKLAKALNEATVVLPGETARIVAVFPSRIEDGRTQAVMAVVEVASARGIE